MDFVVNRSD